VGVSYSTINIANSAGWRKNEHLGDTLERETSEHDRNQKFFEGFVDLAD
jgi:hypothetical protein